MPEMVGGLFSAFTVKRNVSLAVAVPSLTVTVIIAAPNWLVTGRTLTVRLEPLPPKRILALGASAGLEELPLRIKELAALSTSPTRNGIGPVAAFWLVT